MSDTLRAISLRLLVIVPVYAAVHPVGALRGGLLTFGLLNVCSAIESDHWKRQPSTAPHSRPSTYSGGSAVSSDGSQPWKTLWRRQTGMWGFLVEWTVWLNVVLAALKVLTWVLAGTAWLLERAT